MSLYYAYAVDVVTDLMSKMTFDTLRDFLDVDLRS